MLQPNIAQMRTLSGLAVPGRAGSRLQAPWREWRQVYVARSAVQDQLGHRLSGGRRVEHAQTL